MYPLNKVVILFIIIFISLTYIYPAQDQCSELTVRSLDKPFLFQGAINADNINVRFDSTVNSKIICTINKGSSVVVVRELYDWYKIRLPKTAPSFIKKDLVTIIGDKTAKALKDNVNIRLFPNESSWILGKVNRNEVVNILEDRGEWYKIEPVNNSFGWIHKNFVDKVATINKTEEIKLTQGTRKENKIVSENPVLEENTFEGTIKPYGKVIKRRATHKFITEDNKILLLKGNNKGSLDNLNYHKVRVTGKLIGPGEQKYPIIEIIKIEALD